MTTFFRQISDVLPFGMVTPTFLPGLGPKSVRREGENVRWYVIQTKPRQEWRALEHLRRQGYTCYLPALKVENLRPGDRVEQERPLFPQYLFIRLDEIASNWYPICSTRGVSRMVRFNGEGVPVADRIIEQIRRRTESHDPCLPYQ